MFKILKKETLANGITKMVIDAPLIAKKAQSGQFLVLRTHDKGERFPLTIADFDREAGTVTIIFAQVGRSTKQLGALPEGGEILDVVGPLGVASHFDPSIKKAAVIGGGLGCAIALPQAKHLKQMGVSVDMIAGFKTKDIIILEKEMTAASDNLIITTDDGSFGMHGFVTDALRQLDYDYYFACGPEPMLRAVHALGKEGQLSFEARMGCGFGACMGCSCETLAGPKRICVDGPVMRSGEVRFA